VVHVSNAISQNASVGTTFSGGGNASADLTNTGTIAISGVAVATGSNFVTAASATAIGSNLISQSAFARQTSTTAANLASVSINNGAGAIISEHFAATAHGAGTGTVGAIATARVDGGVSQYASGKSGADAAASLTNGGTVNIAAIANATAVSVTATGTVQGIANARAHVDQGIAQNASVKSGGTAGSSASVSLSNGTAGLISIGASANASGGPAFASAGVTSGIAQNAAAKSGDALSSITNDGTIDILAVAHATGDAGRRRDQWRYRPVRCRGLCDRLYHGRATGSRAACDLHRRRRYGHDGQ